MNKQPSPLSICKGAYVLHLRTESTVTVRVGALGEITLAAGHYVYVGSARKSIEARVARHRRLAEEKTGKLHWHIDYLLTHPGIELIGQDAFAGFPECDVARRIASLKSASVPVPCFGASDCRSGCSTHLYRVGKSDKDKISPAAFRKVNRKM